MKSIQVTEETRDRLALLKETGDNYEYENVIKRLLDERESPFTCSKCGTTRKPQSYITMWPNGEVLCGDCRDAYYAQVDEV